jgi:hypothetical protein
MMAGIPMGCRLYFGQATSKEALTAEDAEDAGEIRLETQ